MKLIIRKSNKILYQKNVTEKNAKSVENSISEFNYLYVSSAIFKFNEKKTSGESNLVGNSNMNDIKELIIDLKFKKPNK